MIIGSWQLEAHPKNLINMQPAFLECHLYVPCNGLLFWYGGSRPADSHEKAEFTIFDNLEWASALRAPACNMGPEMGQMI
jgi:hypothetical protein